MNYGQLILASRPYYAKVDCGLNKALASDIHDTTTVKTTPLVSILHPSASNHHKCEIQGWGLHVLC